MEQEKKTIRRIDWLAVKSEYLAGTDSLRKVLKKFKVSPGRNPHKHTRGWIDERKKLHKKILEKIKTNVVTTQVTKWKRQTKLWKSVEGEAEKILEVHKGKKTSMSARDLANLSGAIERALKSQRLILDESTENIDQRNIHLNLVDLIQEGENG